MSTERTSPPRGWRRWVPALWTGYGALYVLAFALRGQLAPALVAAALVAAVGVGLAVELRRPGRNQPQQLGWAQDERQRLIHHKAMALVGYAALAAATVACFVTFIVSSRPPSWPMLCVLGLAAVYGGGLAFYQRRM
ncbi:hypothetical protein [Rugosimonospora africana]|uniref:DUF2178 domain-containing protein n=1 Tax=Rugosimonospora africana TaxID=556532 RepID=A0A8J3QX79_9ACTN|nr:hypothetical protein [Rugosimonospora africana]GIH16371.1 hypothetical protein Raf01_45430 [Rugosimonospora africana]